MNNRYEGCPEAFELRQSSHRCLRRTYPNGRVSLT